MPVKGSYLAIAGLGGILLWSGLKGKSWSDVLRQLIAGQQPATAKTTQTIMGTPLSALGYGSQAPIGSGVGPNVSPSASEVAVMSAICAALGAPPTKANVQSMSAWRTKECPWNNQPPDGAQYTHNPFNTTMNGPGVVGNVNSVGVKIYSNWAAGIANTVATLRSYPGIVARLRSGQGLCGFVSMEFGQWSGGGYDQVC